MNKILKLLYHYDKDFTFDFCLIKKLIYFSFNLIFLNYNCLFKI